MFRKTTLIVTMLVAVALCACFAACTGGAFDPASASPREIVDEVRGFFARDLVTDWDGEAGRLELTESVGLSVWSYEGADMAAQIEVDGEGKVTFVSEVDGERVEQEAYAYMMTSAHPAMLAQTVRDSVEWLAVSGCVSFDEAGDGVWSLELDGVETVELDRGIPALIDRMFDEYVEMDGYPDDPNILAAYFIAPILQDVTVTVQGGEMTALSLVWLDNEISYSVG